jgi:hypothetical protein
LNCLEGAGYHFVSCYACCFLIHLNLNYVTMSKEEFEDSKGVIRICNSKKNRQHTWIWIWSLCYVALMLRSIGLHHEPEPEQGYLKDKRWFCYLIMTVKWKWLISLKMSSTCRCAYLYTYRYTSNFKRNKVHTCTQKKINYRNCEVFNHIL